MPSSSLYLSPELKFHSALDGVELQDPHGVRIKRKGTWRETGLFQLAVPHHSPSLRGVREGTQTGQEAGVRNWRNSAYWFAPHDWLSLFS